MVTVKEIESFKEYGKCVSISNGVIEALVTIDLGPRIISFGYVGGTNFMSSDRAAYEIRNIPISGARAELGKTLADTESGFLPKAIPKPIYLMTERFLTPQPKTVHFSHPRLIHRLAFLKR